MDDKEEVLTDEEKVARNKAIIANIAWENSKTSLEHWKATSGIDLAFFQVAKEVAVHELRRHGLTIAEKN